MRAAGLHADCGTAWTTADEALLQDDLRRLTDAQGRRNRAINEAAERIERATGSRIDRKLVERMVANAQAFREALAPYDKSTEVRL